MKVLFQIGELTCVEPDHRFDAKRAGSGPAAAGLHLDPLPLLNQEDVVKLAPARALDAGPRAHAESLHP
jgi:hypothetical protein